MSDLAKMEYPNFIKTTCWVTAKDGDKLYPLKVRISPISISSYIQDILIDSDGTKIDSTRVFVGGMSYNLRMTVEEVDEMMENIDRGMSIKE